MANIKQKLTKILATATRYFRALVAPLAYLTLAAMLADAMLHHPVGRWPAHVAILVAVLLAILDWSRATILRRVLPIGAAAAANLISFAYTSQPDMSWLFYADVGFVGMAILSWARVPWYILLPIAAFQMALLIFGFGSYQGGALFFALAAIVILVNFAIKMLLDHRADLARVLRWFGALTARGKKRHVANMLWLSLPAWIALVLGIAFNLAVQRELVEWAYRSQLVEATTASEPNLEQDAYDTLDRREEQVERRIDATRSEAELKSSAFLQGAVRETLWAVDLFAPPTIATEEACSGFVKEMSFSIGKTMGRVRQALGGFRKSHKTTQKISYTLDQRSACAQAAKSVQDQNQKAHDDARQRLADDLGEKATATQLKNAQGLLDARVTASIENARTFAKARWLLETLFLWLRLLSAVSWILVGAGFLGLLAYLFGRASFDRKKGVAFSLKSGPLSSGKSPAVSALSCEVHDSLALDTTQLVGGRTRREEAWYVSFDAARHGNRTHMRLHLPQWRACFFRRLFTKRLLLTRVPIGPNSAVPPTISAPGDLQLVDCVVDQGREIVFKMGELIAFSQGVKLRSIYSMHVATELFGLGAFYCVAAGEGRLVLSSQGRDVRVAQKGHCLPSGQLVLWDHSAPFRIAQQPTQCGVWLNTPSLVTVADGVTIFDEGRPGDPRIVKQIWRLLRFAASPV